MTKQLEAWNIRVLDPDGAPLTIEHIATDFNGGGLERNFDNTRRAGEPGVIPRPQGFNEIPVSFTVMMVTPNFLSHFAKGIQKPISIQLTAVTRDDDGNMTPYIFNAKGHTSNMPFGELDENDFTGEFSIMASYIKQQMGTTFTLEYDPLNYKLELNGVNLLASQKSTLGV